jgi:hypothetical protein
MVEELAPALRYCNYQISRAGGEAVDPAGLLALAEEGGEGGGSLLQVRALLLLLLLLCFCGMRCQGLMVGGVEAHGVSPSAHTHPSSTYAGFKCEHTTRSSFIHVKACFMNFSPSSSGVISI